MKGRREKQSKSFDPFRIFFFKTHNYAVIWFIIDGQKISAEMVNK